MWRLPFFGPVASEIRGKLAYWRKQGNDDGRTVFSSVILLSCTKAVLRKFRIAQPNFGAILLVLRF